MPLTAESLFREWFLPLYPEDAARDLGRARSEDANPAGNPAILAHLGEAAAIFAARAPSLLASDEANGGAALDLDFSDASIHRLSAALTPSVIERLAGEGAPGTPESALFNLVVHGAAYLGACIVKQHGGAWAVRRPLWESRVRLNSRAGEAELPVFHWWLKSLAEESPASLADRYRAHVEIPCAKPEALPIIAPEDRSLPKISKVRYDVFYKYIKAHLPELKDVGEHFPTPERFEQYGFETLAPMLVGGGRMLVLWGVTKEGLHALWLTKEGFEKAAFWPCDAFPAPIARKVGSGADAKIEVILSRDGAPQSFELLWWGP